MKGIALETIAYFIIALFTITLILGLVSGKISSSIKDAYCSFIRGLKSILPIPSYLKPPLPVYCERNISVYMETIPIETSYPDRIRDLISAYIIACWEKTGRVGIGQDILCYELVLKNGVDSPGVTADSINQTLAEEGHPNLLDWNTDPTITVARSIGISYDSNNEKIKVS